jgi:diguanylate cyclase (GGDEF)-like protein
MANTIDILAQFKQLELSGALDKLEELRRENRELERIITEVGTLISYTDMNAMLDFVISRILDHFIPQFFAFLIHPPRGPELRQYCYRNLQESNDRIPEVYYSILRARFSRTPAAASFSELEDELGPEQFSQEFRSFEPQYLFPMSGIGGIYGVVILGKKLIGGEYTTREQHYVLRLTKVLSVCIQNGLHYESSITDPKTGLFTHDYFMSQLHTSLANLTRHHRPIGILMLDIDHFKKFNDTWGHMSGDLMINSVARVLHSSVRTEDCVARFGGEEFSVLVMECTAQSLFRIAERIRKAIEGIRLKLETGTELTATVSIGARFVDTQSGPPKNADNSPQCLSTSLQDAQLHHGSQSITDAARLIEEADIALYYSKAHGRNRTTLYAKGLLERAEFCVFRNTDQHTEYPQTNGHQ